jgi:hypothetical protein
MLAPEPKFFQTIEFVEKNTVASRPKILQNNSKPAVEKSDWPGKFGFGRYWKNRQKTGRKKYLWKNASFAMYYGHLLSNFLKHFFEHIFQNNP